MDYPTALIFVFNHVVNVIEPVPSRFRANLVLSQLRSVDDTGGSAVSLFGKRNLILSLLDYATVLNLQLSMTGQVKSELLQHQAWLYLSYLCLVEFSACVHAQLLQLCLTLCDPMDCRLLCPQDSPGKDPGVSCHFLLHSIFPTQGSNLRLLCLLHCRWILYPWSHWGDPLWGVHEQMYMIRSWHSKSLLSNIIFPKVCSSEVL